MAEEKRTSKTSRRIVIALLGVAAAIGFAAALLRALMIPKLEAYLEGWWRDHYSGYSVVFGELSVEGFPPSGWLDVKLHTVRVLAADGEVVGVVPDVELGLTVDPLGRRFDVREVRIVNAKLRLVRTIGGSFKFDLGHRTDGAAGQILANLLDSIAATPSAATPAGGFPSLVLLRADLTLADEASGALLYSPVSDLRIEPHPRGIRLSGDLALIATGERFGISGAAVFDTRDQTILATLTLDGVRPGALAEMIPDLEFLTPFELPVSGSVELEMNPLLEVSLASFHLAGGAGSLEVSEAVGRNLPVVTAQVRGRFRSDPMRVDLYDAKLGLPSGAQLDLTAVLRKLERGFSLTFDLVAMGTSLRAALPNWFARLESEVAQLAEDGSAEPDVTSLTFDGQGDDGQGGGLEGRGSFSYSAFAPGSDRALDPGETEQRSEQLSGVFLVHGAVLAPNFVVLHLNRPMKGHRQP